MLPIILDASIVLFIVIFAILGIRQGFVRALCSFLSVFVALFGAIFITKTFTPTTVEFVKPHLLPSISEKLNTQFIPPSIDSISTSELATILENIGIPASWAETIQGVLASALQSDLLTSSTQLLSDFVLNIFVTIALFIVSFFVLLLLWKLITRSLDLVASLPVLSFFNRSLGALVGIAKALIFLYVLQIALINFISKIPLETMNSTYIFQHLSAFFSELHLHYFIF